MHPGPDQAKKKFEAWYSFGDSLYCHKNINLWRRIEIRIGKYIFRFKKKILFLIFTLNVQHINYIQCKVKSRFKKSDSQILYTKFNLSQC